jgi:predicted nuclease of restriction endonuclease-like RecB superfamily
LIACRGWRLHAILAGRGGRWHRRLELSDIDGLTSHLPRPDEFDSSLEERFAREWGTGPREEWTLEREAEILHDAQHTFVPDFLFRRSDGRKVLLEIVGYWTPEYLRAKLRTLERFSGQPILLAVSAAKASLPWPADVIYFKRVLPVQSVLERLKLL